MSKVTTVAVLLGIPVPPLADVIEPVVLLYMPGVVSLASTLTMQVPPVSKRF
jgi:hypothetical protein